MSDIHGFTLLEERNIVEVGGLVRLYLHKKTHAKLISILNSDINKCFGVTFRTPPKDSKGVAHILEHALLCGSEKYPSKEPFVELLKSSLQTFLNALTYPDKTSYPVASTNTQDLYNLIDVYLDAVFFSQIHKEKGRDIFRQEGWHIDTSTLDEDNTRKWQYKGVVYNEMKGVYSSPDSLLSEQSQYAIFPDTLYSFDSGGNPHDIIKLTYEEFLDFYEEFYHPSNAFFYFWGDDDENLRLKKINDVISIFNKKEIKSKIPLQEARNKTRKITIPFQSANFRNQDEKSVLKSHARLSWLLCPRYKTEEYLLFLMLNHILNGSSGSPLKARLLDSALGEDVTTYLETDLAQMYYSIGMRSIQLGKEDAMQDIILDTLQNLSKNGISQKAINAAINSVEFELREGSSCKTPRGIIQMMQCLSYWLYDENPFNAFEWEKTLEEIKEKLHKKEALFEQLIQKYFLNNKHRVLVCLEPDEKLKTQKTLAESKIMTDLKTSMTKEQQLEIEEECARLQEMQNKEDSCEDLATIPTLSIEDLPKQNTILPINKKEGEFTLLTHEIDTTGVLYTRLIFNFETIPYDLLPLLAVYSRILTQIGTKNYDFAELAFEIESNTGGISSQISFQAIHGEEEALSSFVLSSKVTKEKIPHLIGLLDEIIYSQDFGKIEKIKQIILQEKARMEQGLIPAGHVYVALQLGAMLSKVGHLQEYTQGIKYLDFLRNLLIEIEQDWQPILCKFKYIHENIFYKENAILDLIGTKDLLKQAEEAFIPFMEKLPYKQKAKESWLYEKTSNNKALILPSQVNYNGMAVNLYDSGYVFHASSLVITRFLRMTYLWDKVRLLGGAYGCVLKYSRATGCLNFVSFRDPQIEKTFDAYKAIPHFLEKMQISSRDLSCAIIGTIGDMDTYLRPEAQGSTALWRHLLKETNELRQEMREEILSTKQKHFNEFAEILHNAYTHAKFVSLGGYQLEEYANKYTWKTIKLL